MERRREREKEHWPNQFMKAVAARCLFNWNAMHYYDTKASYHRDMCVHILPCAWGMRFCHFFVHSNTECEAQKCAKGIFEAFSRNTVRCTREHQHELKFIISIVNADNGLIPWSLPDQDGAESGVALVSGEKFSFNYWKLLFYFILYISQSSEQKHQLIRTSGWVVWVTPPSNWMFIKFIQDFHLFLSLARRLKLADDFLLIGSLYSPPTGHLKVSLRPFCKMVSDKIENWYDFDFSFVGVI